MIDFLLTLLAMMSLGVGFIIPISKDKKNIGISFFIAPVIGYSVMSIVGMFYINYSLQASTYYFLLIFLTIISLCFAIFWVLKNKIFDSLKSDDFKTASICGTLFFISLFFINYFLNPIKDNLLLHRLASDLHAYLASSKHLLEGGGLSNAHTHPFSNEIFINAFRWGLPAVTSFVAWLNNTRVEYIIFYLPLIVYVSGLFASFLILTRVDDELNIKKKTLFLLPIVMVFNVGVIFYLFEGFYPQMISIGLVTLMMSMFLSLRNNLIKDNSNHIIYLNGALISATLVLTYSEAYIILILGIGGVFFLDLIFKNKENIKTDTFFLLIVVLSTIIIFPFISKFIIFTLANSANIGNIGFTFPSRPVPSDWVGIANIFSDTKLYLHDAVATNEVRSGSFYPKTVDIILSCWVSYELIRFFIKKSSSDRAFFLVPLVGIICFLIANLLFTKFFKITTNYYLYNKSITLFLPLVSYCFFFHLYKHKNNIKLSIAVALLSLSLGLFLKDSRTFKSEIDLKIVDYFQDHPDLSNKYLFVKNERGRRDGAVIGKYRYIDRAGDFLLYSLIDVDYFDQWESAHWKYISPEVKNKEVIILVNTDYTLQETLDSFPKNKIIFQAGKYLAISTGVKLKDITDLPQERQYSELEKLFLR